MMGTHSAWLVGTRYVLLVGWGFGGCGGGRRWGLGTYSVTLHPASVAGGLLLLLLLYAAAAAALQPSGPSLSALWIAFVLDRGSCAQWLCRRRGAGHGHIRYAYLGMHVSITLTTNGHEHQEALSISITER